MILSFTLSRYFEGGSTHLPTEYTNDGVKRHFHFISNYFASNTRTQLKFKKKTTTTNEHIKIATRVSGEIPKGEPVRFEV